MPSTPIDATMPTITVECAFTSTPLASVAAWQDITAYVRDIQITRGRSKEIDKFQPSSATITLNNATRAFDPEYADGPYYGYILPNRRIRVTALWAATTYYLWDGFVDAWPQVYTNPSYAETVIPCTDAFGMLSRINLNDPLFVNAVNDGATSYYRLGEAVGATTATDSIGLYPGTYVGPPTLGITGLLPGSTNTAINVVTAGSQYVTLPTQVLSAYPISIEAIVKLFYDGVLDYSLQIFSGRVAGNPVKNELNFFITGSGSASHLRVKLTDPSGNNTWASTSSFNDNAAHHVVVTVDATGNVNLYDNGTDVTDATGVHARALINPTNWVIGLNPDYTFADTSKGTLDEIAVYNGVKLTAAQVTTHYNAYLGWTGDTTAQRATRILNLVNWPSTLQNVGTGLSIVGPNGIAGTGVYDYLMGLQDTENGQCYVDGQGRVTFRGRGQLFTDTRSKTSQAVFGDVGSDA